MELDDLKGTWKNESELTKLNADIMEIIQHKTYGPLAAMKRVFKRQIVLMATIPLLLIATNANDVHAVFTSVMFWTYVVFCMCVVSFAYKSYRIVQHMELMEPVKGALARQIDLLEKRKRWELAGLRVGLLTFVALTEIVPYFQHYRMLDYWHSLPPALRLSAYLALFAMQYFMNRKIARRNIGVHLDYLRRLMNEFDEN